MIISLVFLLLAGIATSALLAQTEVNLKTTSLVRTDEQRSYGADAGIEYGIQQLRTNVDFCPNEGMTKTLTLPSSVNGASVQVTCNNKQGFLDGRTLSGYAVVTTSPGSGSLTATQGGTAVLTGDMFITGSTAIGGGSGVRADRGYSPGHCPVPSGITVAEWHCEARQAPVNAYSLPLTKPGAPIPPAVAGSCRVFYPGTYDAPGQLSLNPTGVNYLVSGVYYLQNQTVSLGNGGVLIGGAPAVNDAAVASFPETTAAIAGCQSAPGAAPSADPTRDRGVELILGGSSSLTVNNQNTVELFTRSPKSGDTGSAGVSLFGVPDPSPRADFLKSSASPILTVDTNSNSSKLLIHGAVYAPTSPVELTARNQGVARLASGVTSRTLLLASSGSANSGFSIYGPPSGWAFTDRYVVLTAQATTASGAVEKAQAVVVVRNDGAQTPGINSWRAVGVS